MSSTHITTLSPLARERRPTPLGPRVWAGSIMLICAVLLVGLGGCFLIGVLGLIRPDLFNPGTARPSGVSLSSEEISLLVILYVLAGLSFLGAVVLFVLGLFGLWRVLRTVEEPVDY